MDMISNWRAAMSLTRLILIALYVRTNFENTTTNTEIITATSNAISKTPAQSDRHFLRARAGNMSSNCFLSNKE